MLLAIIVGSAITAGPAHAQTPGTAAHNACDCSSVTLAKTVPLGADRTLLVSVAMIAGSENLSSVTYNSTAMTQIGSAQHTGNARIYLYELKLGTGAAISANVVVTRSGSAKMVVGALDFAGVDQTKTLTTTPTFGKSRVASVTRPAVENGQVVVDAIAMKSVPSPSLSVGSGQTLLWSQNQSSNGTGAQSRKSHSGATGSVTVSYDKGSGNENEWAMLATTLSGASPPSIGIVKSTASTFTAVGNVVTYGFTVTNTGDVSVTNVSVSDPLVSGSPIAGCAAATLAPGAQTTCSATYTTTQADVDAGQVVNTATATSTETGSVSSNTVTLPFSGTVTKTLAVTKSTVSTFTAVDQVLTYDFTIENTGNVTLASISLSDPLVSGSPIAGCAAATLAPGAQKTCSGTYTTTQADVDAREVVNTAAASSTETGSVSSNTLTLPFTGKVVEWLTAVVSSTSTFTAAGVTLAVDFSVENTGNVTLADIGLSAPLVSGSPIAGCAAATLAPGAKTTCSGSYTTTQGDVDAGKVDIAATATSTETGAVASNTLTLPFAGTATPALTVIKQTTSTFTDLGQLLAFGFTIENTGNVTLTDVGLSDPLVSDSPIAECAAATLAPGGSVTCSGSYTTTQADVDAGEVVNTATATSTQTGAVASNTVTLTFGGKSAPSLTVVKSSTSTFTAAGVTLAYDFSVQNTGNITLTTVSLSDPLVSGEPIAGCVTASLAPGQKIACSATYTTTATDVTNGQVSNTATATSAQTGAVSSNTVTLPFSPAAVPSLTVLKSSTSVFTAVGETLVFDYLLENTGSVTLTHLNVSDALVSGAPLAGCAVASLAPGATAACSAGYATTQADVDAGQVSGSATAVSTETGAVTSNVLTIAFSGTVVRSLTVLLESNATFTGAGQSLAYDLTVENAGTVTVTGVQVSTLLASSPLAGCAAASLAPGARITCSTLHTTTQADVHAGQIANQATAVSAETGAAASNTVVLLFTGQTPVETPAISVSVVSSSASVAPGDTLVYEYTIENTGNVPLTDISLTTTLSSGPLAGCSVASLAPGARLTCTATYVVTAADFHAGRLEHVATATSVETGSVTSSPLLVLVVLDEELVRESVTQATQTFMRTRLNGILMSEPESNRLINRGSGGSGGPMALTGQGDESRMNLAWGTSLRRIRQSSARFANTDDQSGTHRLNGLNTAGGRFDVWLEGTYYRHRRTLQGGRERGEVGLAYTGVDYLLNEHVLVGMLTQFDWTSSAVSGPGRGDDAAEGVGWMAGPYVSARLGGGVHVDVRGAWGRSQNDLSMQVSGVDVDSTFSTTRRLVRATLSGEAVFDRLRIRPTASVAYMKDAQRDYLARAARTSLLVDGQSIALGRMTAGPELSYRFTRPGGGHLEPFVAPSLVWDVQREGMAFDPYRSVETRRGALATGVRFMLRRNISGDALVGVDGLGEQGFGATSVSARFVIPF